LPLAENVRIGSRMVSAADQVEDSPAPYTGNQG
jgi:hypothetical protein